MYKTILMLKTSESEVAEPASTRSPRVLAFHGSVIDRLRSVASLAPRRISFLV